MELFGCTSEWVRDTKKCVGNSMESFGCTSEWVGLSTYYLDVQVSGMEFRRSYLDVRLS